MKKEKPIAFIRISIWKERYEKLQFKFGESYGLDELMKMGWGNGYIAIPPGHPFYNKDYDFINEFVNVHGGLTYGEINKLQLAGLLWTECPENYYVIGFDTAHAWDTLESWPKELVQLETDRLLAQVVKYNSKVRYFFKWLQNKIQKRI